MIAGLEIQRVAHRHGEDAVLDTHRQHVVAAREFDRNEFQGVGRHGVAGGFETVDSELAGEGVDQIAVGDVPAPAQDLAQAFAGAGLLDERLFQLGGRDQTFLDENVAEFRGAARQ